MKLCARFANIHICLSILYLELKRKISELESKINELTKHNEFLQYQVDKYESQLNDVNDDNDSQTEVVSDGDTRPAKRPRKKLSDEEEKEKVNNR